MAKKMLRLAPGLALLVSTAAVAQAPPVGTMNRTTPQTAPANNSVSSSNLRDQAFTEKPGASTGAAGTGGDHAAGGGSRNGDHGN